MVTSNGQLETRPLPDLSQTFVAGVQPYEVGVSENSNYPILISLQQEVTDYMVEAQAVWCFDDNCQTLSQAYSNFVLAPNVLQSGFVYGYDNPLGVVAYTQTDRDEEGMKSTLHFFGTE